MGRGGGFSVTNGNGPIRCIVSAAAALGPRASAAERPVPPPPPIRSPRLAALALCLGLALPGAAWGDEVPTCDGPFAGRALPAAELDAVLAVHRTWLQAYDAVLGDYLRWLTQFRGVVLHPDSAALDAALADPRRANLCGARLAGARLAGARLGGSDLSGSDLGRADLAGADLAGADLTGADLAGADLSRADLTGADLTGVDLAHANLFGAVFEPRLSGRDLPTPAGTAPPAETGPGAHAIGFPDLDAMAWAENLDRMVFTTSPTPLKQLRDAFQERGHVASARQVAASMQWASDQHRIRHGTPAERAGAALRLLALGVTCSYGAAPGRAAAWLLCLILAFAIPYARIIALEGTGVDRLPAWTWTRYAMAGANFAVGLVLLAPSLVLDLPAAAFLRLGFAADRPGEWAAALLGALPAVYAACAALLGTAVAARRRWFRGRASALALVAGSGLLTAGLLAIPSLLLFAGPPGSQGPFGGLTAVTVLWLLLLVLLMHLAGTYARTRDGAIQAHWAPEAHVEPAVEPVGFAFFRPGAEAPPAGWRGALAPMAAVTKGAFWFSLVITLRIGWKDLSLGSWLTHVQPRPYTLVPVGGLRVVCGLQSIIGLYLMTLLLLTYFRPLFAL